MIEVTGDGEMAAWARFIDGMGLEAEHCWSLVCTRLFVLAQERLPPEQRTLLAKCIDQGAGAEGTGPA